jgi:hypothetical protein
VAEVRTGVRQWVMRGLLSGGLVLVVLGAVLATLGGGVFAVVGVAGGGVAVALLSLLSRARAEPPGAVGTARLVAAQPVVLAALITGMAVAVAGSTEGAARVVGGALAAVAAALDCLLIAFWRHGRPGGPRPDRLSGG